MIVVVISVSGVVVFAIMNEMVVFEDMVGWLVSGVGKGVVVDRVGVTSSVSAISKNMQHNKH